MTVAQSFVDAYAPHGPYVSPCSHASTSTHANVTGAVAPGPRRQSEDVCPSTQANSCP